jgi:hypothetical protein
VTPSEPGFSREAGVVLSNLRVDWVSAQVLRAFGAAQIESLLLKGASVARWLYANDDPRLYVDCDLLVRPSNFAAAEDALAGLGFELGLEHRDMPAWWQEHAVGWLHPEDGVAIDLHRDLPGVGVDAERLWSILWGRREPILIAGFEAQTLTTPGRAFMLSLHAAHHGVGWDKVMADLERGVERADFGTWRAAADLARELEAAGAFATGLRLVPGGRDLADRLDLPRQVSSDVALKAASPPPVALGFDQLARADGLRTRFAILRYKLIPPPTFMRHWSPDARDSRLALLRAYVRRPFWLLRRAPAGFRAWRKARRSP